MGRPEVGLSPTEQRGSRSWQWGRSGAMTVAAPGAWRGQWAPSRAPGCRETESGLGCALGGGTNSAGSAKAFKASEQGNDLELCVKLFTSAGV